jgi:hypothetical protein
MEIDARTASSSVSESDFTLGERSVATAAKVLAVAGDCGRDLQMHRYPTMSWPAIRSAGELPIEYSCKLPGTQVSRWAARKRLDEANARTAAGVGVPGRGVGAEGGALHGGRPEGRPEGNALEAFSPGCPQRHRRGGAVMVRIEVGSGCET